MQTGKFYIEQLSEGLFKLFSNGDLQKIEPAEIDKLKSDPSLRAYSSAIGIDPIFISDGHLRIVADPGLGWGLDNTSNFKDTSNVVTNLDIFGIKPEDIDIVILTHLHYDHAAGSTYVDKNFETVSTFPNATYIVQQKEWDFAIEQTLDNKAKYQGVGYKMDELYKLYAENRIQFISKSIHKITSGLELIHTGGHTPGHQILRMSSKNETAYFLGDLIPTEHHLNHYAMKQIDTDPLMAKKIKTTLLREACQSNAVLLFYHSLYTKSGKLSQDKHKKYILLDT